MAPQESSSLLSSTLACQTTTHSLAIDEPLKPYSSLKTSRLVQERFETQLQLCLL
jgi:hypothetical protein